MLKIGEQIPQAIANRESFILDGTSASKNQTIKLVNELKEAGYEVMMLYVYTDLETSLKRNQERFEKSGGEDRSLLPGSVLSAWKSVTQNFEDYQNLFGDNFVSVANTGDSETMKDIENICSKSKAKPRHTRYSTIRPNTKYYKFFCIKRRSTK